MSFTPRSFLYSACIFLTLAQSARAATLNATWNTAADVPVSASSYTATGNTVNFTLNFTPSVGTQLTVVNNTGLPFISGTFDNLTQGQTVSLSYNGIAYPFVASYFSGTGNDLVLVWAESRPAAWGYNADGELGNNNNTNSGTPVAVTTASPPLAVRTLLALSAGAAHSLALCSDGSLFSWGNNYNGGLGNGTNISSGLPVAVTTTGTPLAGKGVVAVSAGGSHSLALCSDGTLAAWGYSYYGQLGNGTTTSSSVPVAVTTAGTPLAGKAMVAISAGGTHSLALCSDGTLAAWGYNVYGQLGNGTTTDSSVPVAVTRAFTPLAGKTVIAVAAGDYHSLVLCSDGTLVAWGYNAFGQLGNGTTTDSSMPVVVTTAGTPLAGKTVIAVAAGGYHSLALCSDGTLAAWGRNTEGELGNNSTTYNSIPVAVSTSGVLAGKAVVSIAAGEFHSMALCADGTLVAWGYNGDGELGNNSTMDSSIPVAVDTSSLAPAESFMRVTTGSGSLHNLGLVASPIPVATTLAATSVNTTTVVLNGTVNANGGTAAASFDYGLDSSYGAAATGVPDFATGSSDTAVSTTLTGLIPNTTYHFRARGGVSRGSDMTFTTRNGNLSALTLSAGVLSPAFSPTVYSYLVAVAPAVSSISITPTTSDSQATVTVSGNPVASGSASSPVPLAYGDNTINVVVTASDHVSTVTYAFIVTRAVPTAWTVAYASAADVPASINGFTPTGGRVNFSLNYAPLPGTTLTVVKNTGLGFINGTFDNLAQGQVVNLGYNGATYPFVASYYGGTGNDLVLIWASTRLAGWGFNYYGQLGNNSTTTTYAPVAVTTAGTPLDGRTLLAHAAGGSHTLALCSDGSLAAWGYNGAGELGNGTTTNSSVPVAVTTAGTPLAGKTVVAIAAGEYHNFALCSDGTLAAWGYNYNGQLGNGATTNCSVPVAVATAGTPLAGKTVVAIAAGYSHSLALCSDGTLAAWGDNTDGELGNGTSTSSLAPVMVATTGTALAGRTVVAIAVGQYHNLALCADGTLVAWGYNSAGQLGIGTTTSSRVPVAVTTAGTPLAGKTVVAIAAGEGHSLALCSDGTLVAWGYNGYGELGNGTTASSLVPVMVAATSTVLAGKTVVGLSAGESFSLARCTDGTVAAWGNNGIGQLGINNYLNRSSLPAAVSTSSLAAGESFIRVATGSSASHSLGVVASPIPSYTTLTATTLAATSAAATTVVLNGTVNANGGTATVSFDYGLDSSYGTNVAGTPDFVTGGSATAVTATLTGLTPNTTYHFRANGSNGSGTTNGADLTFTTLTLLQNWRLTNFGTIFSSGLMADTADYDGDGIPNLMEFALNLDPKAASKLPISSTIFGATFQISYSRSTAAVRAGTSYAVEWNASLSAASWSNSGVTQWVLSDNGTTQMVIAMIPVNAAARMFVHLSVTAPP